MDRKMCKEIMDSFKAIASEDYPEYKVTVAGSYGKTEMTIKITLVEKSETGVALTQERTSLLQMAKIFGWSETDLGKVVNIPRIGKCKLVGFNGRAKAYPWQVTCLDNGKNYKMSEDHLKTYFGLKCEIARKSIPTQPVNS